MINMVAFETMYNTVQQFTGRVNEIELLTNNFTFTWPGPGYEPISLVPFYLIF